jgi:capsular polysaccharide transport system permease protein
MYSRPQADFLARFPSIIFGRTDEELYEYYQRMITVIHSEKTGITTLKTYAFTAGDAQRIAQALLRQGEALINRINRRIQSDAIANSERRLEAARAKVVEAQTALVTFRNTELTIDPEKSAVALMDLIGRLAAELGLVQAQMTQLNQSATGSPTLTALQVRASALETQIREERLKISGNKGLADRISKYERLSLELEFANRSMTAAEAEAAKARSEATRQLLYLERIVEPSLPDEATYPKRMRKIVTVFVVNILLASLLWLVVTGVKEHGAGSR